MKHLMPYLVTLINVILYKCKRSRTRVTEKVFSVTHFEMSKFRKCLISCIVNQFINTNSVTACIDGETELYETPSQLNQLLLKMIQ